MTSLSLNNFGWTNLIQNLNCTTNKNMVLSVAGVSFLKAKSYQFNRRAFKTVRILNLLMQTLFSRNNGITDVLTTYTKYNKGIWQKRPYAFSLVFLVTLNFWADFIFIFLKNERDKELGEKSESKKPTRDTCDFFYYLFYFEKYSD